LFSSRCLKVDNLIIGGNLNFTLNRREISGSSPRVDRLDGFLHNLFNEESVVDIDPIKLTPTWSNNISGIDCVSKKFDRFLIHRYFL